MEKWNTLLPSLTALLGILIGSYLTYRYSYSLYIKQKKFENQRISFARLMSLKIPWTQSIRTNVEAKILCEYYETRHNLFSHNIEDLNESKRQNDRALSLIPEISKSQKETFETLGLIQTCYDIDTDLEQAINDLFYYQSLQVLEFPKSFNTQIELDNFKNEQFSAITSLLKREYEDRFDKILNILKKKLH